MGPLSTIKELKNFIETDIILSMPTAINSYDILTPSKNKITPSDIRFMFFTNENYVAEILTENTIVSIFEKNVDRQPIGATWIVIISDPYFYQMKEI